MTIARSLNVAKRLVLTALLLTVNQALFADCLNFHVIQNEPIGYKDASGNATGVHWDYLAAIEEESGLCINKQLMPYARLWLSMEKGQHDGGIAFRSKNHESLIHPVEKIRVLATVIFPRKDIKIDRYEDLAGLYIGKTKGTRLSDKFDNDESLLKVDLVNYKMAANMLKLGRIDAIAGSQIVLTYQLSKYNAIDNLTLEKPFVLGEREQWLQLSKKSKHLDHTEQLRDAINTLKLRGVFDQIMIKYHGQTWQLHNEH